MTYVIYKYKIDGFPISKVQIPQGAKILKAAMQCGVLCVWAMVNPARKYDTYKFRFVPTGDNVVESDYTYVDTVFTDGGSLVWHLFYKIEND